LNGLDTGDVRPEDAEGYRRGAMGEPGRVIVLDRPIVPDGPIRACSTSGPMSLALRPVG
jgi:hypothetical protein